MSCLRYELSSTYECRASGRLIGAVRSLVICRAQAAARDAFNGSDPEALRTEVVVHH